MMNQEELSAAIRELLQANQVSGVLEEQGVSGNLRVTFCCVLPPAVAEEIFDLAKTHQIRTLP